MAGTVQHLLRARVGDPAPAIKYGRWRHLTEQATRVPHGTLLRLVHRGGYREATGSAH